MRLHSTDGAEVILRPARYEFPESDGDPTYGGSANWLIIGGTVRTSFGVSWGFVDPFLTAREVRRLAAWLDDVVAGAVPVINLPVREEADGLCSFMEPNLALTLAHRDDERVIVRVHLSQDCAPPGELGEYRFHLFRFYVPISISLADLAVARDEWMRDIDDFPVRVADQE